MPKGGKRPGTGTKAGEVRGPYASTISKEQTRELVRQLVLQHIEPLVKAQVANASGLQYLVARDAKTGKFIRFTEEMFETQAEGFDRLEVWTKDPSVQAFTDLLNRCIDKPSEAVSHEHSGNVSLSVTWKKPRA